MTMLSSPTTWRRSAIIIDMVTVMTSPHFIASGLCDIILIVLEGYFAYNTVV